MSWGYVKASDVVNETTQKRFEEFLASLLAGQVVPLLGAGASIDSVPSVDGLLDGLKSRIQPPFDPATAGRGDFNRLAEVLQWQHKGKAAPVCDALKIADWAEAPPTRAHRYLALLACEGVISDVITTNYDGGLEQAWRQARGGAADGWEPVNHEGALGGRRSRWGAPNLRLYKINGCASRLRDAETAQKKEARAQEIQLTDLQLQRFGQRRWAQRIFESLFQDRQLALSGFGSDEAQVWFVVMDILGELRGKPGGRRYLWVAEYSDRIGFHLLQALVGELRVRWPRRRKLQFDNVFSKDDRAFFEGEDRDGLDAGDFWRRTWIETLRSGLTDRDGPVVKEFTCAATGLPFRPSRPQDDAVAGCWEEVVRQVFEASASWLDEPTRDDGSSRWAKRDALTFPDANAPCAPGLACLELPGGETRYKPLSEAPEYWVVLILVLRAMPEEQYRMQGTLDDHEPCIEVGLGDGGRKITRVVPHLPGHVSVVVDPPAQGARRVRRETRIDLLGGLRAAWSSGTGCDALAAAVHSLVNRPDQPARESEAFSRESRRVHLEAP